VVLELEARRRLRVRWKHGVSLSLSRLHERRVCFTVLEHLGQIVNARIGRRSSTYEVEHDLLGPLDVNRIPLALDPREAYGGIENYRR
jgi:hypothetical protein